MHNGEGLFVDENVLGRRMKTAMLIDGGYLRACVNKSKRKYDNKFIIKFSKTCFLEEEYVFRIFYYDAPQFKGAVEKPVSGEKTEFNSNDNWLVELSKTEKFAVRRGSLGFRGWKPKQAPLKGGKPLVDDDFSPIFEQKGVDMRIGLDIANFSYQRTIERIILISGDTDMIPAMKLARRCGIEIISIQLDSPTKPLHNEIQAHSDFVRKISWCD